MSSPSLLKRVQGRVHRVLHPPPTGRLLKNKWLAKTLKNDMVGMWALDSDSLNYLEACIKELKPAYVLEFGAGISTICLARWMVEMHGQTQVRVFSIEQNEWQIAASVERLQTLGLGSIVKILSAPLVPRTIAGVDAITYDLCESALDDFFGNARPSLVIVDGPAGDDLTRFATIPQVRSYLVSGAKIFLDDKNRPEERAVMARWLELPYIEPVSGGTDSMAAFVYREPPLSPGV